MRDRILTTIMQEIRIYDPNRTPANWTEVMSATQFAVFHSDVLSGAPRNARGNHALSEEQSTCLVFDSLPEAVAFCESQQDVPRLRLDIYDKAGKANEPIRSFVGKGDIRRALSARLYLGIGISRKRCVADPVRLGVAVGMDLANRCGNQADDDVFLVWWWVKRK